MWLRISTQHLKNAADNQHALEQRFFEYRFHPEHDVMHHITEIETIANQLRDINAPVTESQIMTKIISTLPPSYRGFMSAWDSVPISDRTINSLTSRTEGRKFDEAMEQREDRQPRCCIFHTKLSTRQMALLSCTTWSWTWQKRTGLMERRSLR